MSQPQKPDLSKHSDDDLFDMLREQINLSRQDAKGYDRPLVRALGDEMRSRGILDAASPYASTLPQK